MSEFNQAWFVVPNRIMKLEGLTLAFLRIYETIFQFWNNDKPCYLSNAMIMERTGIKSERSIQEAFIFFEKHNEITRKIKDGRRYLIQPTRYVELEGKDLSTPPAENCGVPPQQTATPPRRELRHKNNNLNNNKLNKSSSDFKNQKQPATGYVERNTVSDEAKTASKGSIETAEYYLSKMKGVSLKRYRNRQGESECPTMMTNTG